MAIIRSDSFEPHPVSGEVELGDVLPVQYRRMDEETFQWRVQLIDIGLVVIYLWCEGDQEGGGNGWRVSEVQPYPPMHSADNNDKSWWNTMDAANEAAQEDVERSSLRSETAENSIWSGNATMHVDEKVEDDDDYWAQYDCTPARTPAVARSPAPNGFRAEIVRSPPSTSDAEYYAQYSQVQPAMESHDPSEVHPGAGQSTLNGTEMLGAATRPEFKCSQRMTKVPIGDSVQDTIVHTRPSSSASSISAVARLEESAATQSHGEIAVQQHISSSLKSLFWLACGMGIEKEEFERLVRNELDMLSMLRDDY